MDGFIKALRNFVTPQLSGMNLHSPVPEGENLSNQALLGYYSNEDPPMPTKSPSTMMGIMNPHIAQPAQATTNNPLDQLTSQIHQGFTRYGSPPVATVSAALAKAGQGLPDPLLPAVIALKESSGGKATTYLNNYLNMGHWGYPTMEGAATGGGGHIGIMQQLQDPKYNDPYRDYMKSGDLTDFFKAYTPPGAEGNASIPDQIKEYNTLRNNFTK